MAIMIKKLSAFVPPTLLVLLVFLSIFDQKAWAFSLTPTNSVVGRTFHHSHLNAEASEISPETSAQESKPKKKNKQPQVRQPQVVLDVSKLDIRVGLIEKCWEHEEADRLYCEEINLGEEEGPRLIASGLKAHYSIDEIVGKKVLVLANLKSRKLVGFPSHGMVLCACQYGEAEDGSEDTVEFVCPPKSATIGDRLVCEGFEGEPATENQVVKKKILNAVFPDLRVDTKGVVVYKDVPLKTESGGESCTSESLKDVPIS